jgi:WD40 repeat protein
VRVWDAATAAELATLRGPGGPIESLAYSPDGGTLAAGGAERLVTLWDAATFARVGMVEAADDWVNAIALSRDGSLLATSGSYGDPTVRVWDTAAWRQKFRLEGFSKVSAPEDRTGMLGRAHTLAFDGGGTTLAVGADGGTVRFFDMLSGEELGSATTGQEGRVCAVAFSPDGTVLATGADDGTVRLWRAASPADVPPRATSDR